METSKKVGPFTKMGCYLIGWNPEILKECGEASHRTLKKYVSAIVILSVIWGSIGYCFADRYIGIENLLGKIVVAAVFVTIIICIERFIILTVGKLGKMVFMRGALAFLMAVLGSTIFDQIIFKNDVDVKMKEIRDEQISIGIPKRMSYLDADIKRVTALIDSVGRENIKIYEKLAAHPVIVATDVNTTTKNAGVDHNGKPIEEKVTSVTKRNVENPLSGQAKANEAALKNYQDQLDSYQKEKMQVAVNVRKEYEGAEVGFLQELKALFSILREDNVAFLFYLFLFLFLMLLELLVIFNKGGDGTCDYDLAVEHQLRIKSETLRKTEESLLQRNRN